MSWAYRTWRLLIGTVSVITHTRAETLRSIERRYSFCLCQVTCQWWDSSVLLFVIVTALWWTKGALTSCPGRCSWSACSWFIQEFRFSRSHSPSLSQLCSQRMWSTRWPWLWLCGGGCFLRCWQKMAPVDSIEGGAAHRCRLEFNINDTSILWITVITWLFVKIAVLRGMLASLKLCGFWGC